MTESSTRLFHPDDAAAVRAVMAASLATDTIPGFTADDIERAMVRILPDPDAAVVALEDGVVVGYCTSDHDDLTGHRPRSSAWIRADHRMAALGGTGRRVPCGAGRAGRPSPREMAVVTRKNARYLNRYRGV